VCRIRRIGSSLRDVFGIFCDTWSHSRHSILGEVRSLGQANFRGDYVDDLVGLIGGVGICANRSRRTVRGVVDGHGDVNSDGEKLLRPMPGRR
jgi:hypothetical protein